jgi:cytoskeleton protein RodZ
MPREQPARWPMQILFAAMAIVGALAIYEFGFNEPRGDAKEAETTATPGGDAAAAEASLTAAPVAPPAAPSTPAPASSAAAAKVAPSVAAPPPAAGAAATTLPGARGQGELIATAPAADAAKAPAGQRALQLKFDVESWVEIRDGNDKIIFSKLNRAGSEERVNGVPPLKLVVGNARGVHLNYDDKPVDLSPHIGVTVARLTLQ